MLSKETGKPFGVGEEWVREMKVKSRRASGVGLAFKTRVLETQDITGL